MDIIERLRWSISADTPARYPDIVGEAADEIERLRAALGKAFIAMRIAAALPAVAAEYDFGNALAEAQSVLYGKLAPVGLKLLMK